MSNRRHAARPHRSPDRLAPLVAAGRDSGHPTRLTLDGDAGSRQRTALALQASAGNRAVAASVAEISRVHAMSPGSLAVITPRSATAAPAPGGVSQIATEAEGRNAAGVTILPSPSAPDVVIGAPVRQTDGRWQVSVQPTTVGSSATTSLYPGVGVHDEGTTATGMIIHRDVTGAAADEIKRGEEEHLLDLEWARHLAYDEVADAVNRVAASGPVTGNSADEARAAGMQAVRSAIPGRARWPAGVDPSLHWRRTYGRLVAVTQERDSVNHWHNISTQIVLDPADKRALNLPVADELRRYIPGTTKVGQHQSEPLVRARYDSLPVGPAGAGGQGPATGNLPADAFSPAGDYEYKPSDKAIAVRRRRA